MSDRLLILQFLGKSIDAVKDEDWTQSLAAAYAKQLPLYSQCPKEKVLFFFVVQH